MSVSLAETAWASTCSPAMDMHRSDATVADGVPAHVAMVGSPDDREDEGSGEDERRCPFTPAAAQACTGVALLPAQAVADVGFSIEHAAAMFVEPIEHDLLFSNALFRPPRA